MYMNVREWFDRGRQSADPFDAFSNFWRAFNKLYSTVGQGYERDKIKLFLRQQLSEAQAMEILQINASSVSYLLSRPVIDMRGNGKDTAPNIQAFHAADDSLTKLQELFMIIYQVRCNLEHGEKSPSMDRDLMLCQLAAPLVAYVVEQNVLQV
jgi:hypothetical protein